MNSPFLHVITRATETNVSWMSVLKNKSENNAPLDVTYLTPLIYT